MATNYAPKASQTFTTGGAIRNISDGINSDGSLNVKSQAAAPRTLSTTAFSTFTTASTTAYIKVSGLTRNALQRTFTIYSTLNQPLAASQCSISMFDSTIANPATPPAGITFTAFGASSLPTNGFAVGISENHPDLCAHVDSAFVAIPVGATLPTSGNIVIYVTELL